MFKKTAAVALTAAALMLNAPAAHADAPVRSCRFYAVSTNGSNFDGVMAGSITHEDGGTVSITCYLRVNFVIQGGTFASGSGETAAVAANAISFQADEFDYVEVCTNFTTQHGTVTECFETGAAWLPPDLFTDLICEVTRFIGGLGFNILGVVVIEPDGDVFLAGIKVVDCNSFAAAPLTVRFS